MPATEVANCKVESENQTAPARACDLSQIDPDMITHHNERGKKERGPAPKTEPAEEPDYDAEGMIPSN